MREMRRVSDVTAMDDEMASLSRERERERERFEAIESFISNMKTQSHGHVIGIPVLTSVSYEEEHACVSEPVSHFLDHSSNGSFNSKQNRKDSVIHWMNKLGKKTDNYVQGIRAHLTLGPKISETVKGKLSLSARIIQAGGVEKAFRQLFSVKKGEKLLKASQCHLSTTAGPISGLLFISTQKVAFHSDRSIPITSPKGDITRVPYKVLIPLRRIKCAVSTENEKKPNQKYVQIVTVDGFDFWFMGFVSFEKSFMYLRTAILVSQT